MSVPVHPLALLIPEMTAEQYAELRTDIEQRGLMHPIVLHEHMILDGRHRARACEETGVEPRYTDFDGPSPIEFVVSVNVKRRHLTPSQLAAIAVDFLPAMEEEAKHRQGERSDLTSDSKESEVREPDRATKLAGQLVGVSRASVTRAKRVHDEDPDMFEKVKNGAVTVTAADSAIRDAKAAERAAPAELRTERDEQRAHAHRRKVIDIVSTLSGFARGLDDIDVNRARAVMDEAELREWDRSLSDSLSKLRGFRSDLQKGRP